MNQKHEVELPIINTRKLIKRQINAERKLTEKEAILVLNLVISIEATNDILTELQYTSLYNQAIKRDAKSLMKNLEPIRKDASESLFGVASDEMDEIINSKKELLKQLNNTSPEDWQIAPYILKWVNEKNTYSARAVRALCVQSDAENV